MAGERTLPGLGIYGYWNDGSAGWGAQHSDGIRKLSVMSQLSAKSRVTALPGSPTDGDIYIVPGSSGANPNEIAVRDNGAWVYFVPRLGFLAYVEDEKTQVLWNGTSWEMAFGPVLIESTAANIDLTDLHLNGRTILELNNAGPNTVTINSGLVGKGPLTLIQKGAGTTTVVSGTGAPVISTAGSLVLNGQFAFATLVPRGANAYYLAGNLA